MKTPSEWAQEFVRRWMDFDMEMHPTVPPVFEQLARDIQREAREACRRLVVSMLTTASRGQAVDDYDRGWNDACADMSEVLSNALAQDDAPGERVAILHPDDREKLAEVLDTPTAGGEDDGG